MMLAPPPAPPVASAPLAIGFAPPLGRTLRYETEERRFDAEGERRFTMVHAVRFSRTADGYLMEARLVAADAVAPADVQRHYDAAMRPFVGVPTTLALGEDGGFRGIRDAAGTWTKVVASLSALTDALERDPAYPRDRLAATRAYIDRFAAMPDAERDAALSEGLLALMAPAALPRTRDASASCPAGGEPDGGTIRLVAESPEEARFVCSARSGGAVIGARAADAARALGTGGDAAAEARSAAAAGLTEEESLVVARRSGLLLTRERHTSLGEGPEATLLAIRVTRALPTEVSSYRSAGARLSLTFAGSCRICRSDPPPLTGRCVRFNARRGTRT